MKAIIGIDRSGAYKPTLDLIAKLGFAKLQLILLQAAPTESPIPFPDARMEAEYTKVVQNLGLAALDAAMDQACSRNLKAETKLVFGRAADSMMREAEQLGADLIGLCATHRGDKHRSYLGSATCALAVESQTSLLVAKEAVTRTKPFTAVLATGHGKGSDAWIRRFIEMAPKGIAHLHVISAYEVDDEAATATRANIEMMGGDIDRWLHDAISDKAEAVADRLSEAGFETSFKVVKAPTAVAIRDAMQEGRELLIIGADENALEHGAKIGSVALRQVVAEYYPVLIVRP